MVERKNIALNKSKENDRIPIPTSNLYLGRILPACIEISVHLVIKQKVGSKTRIVNGFFRFL